MAGPAELFSVGTRLSAALLSNPVGRKAGASTADRVGLGGTLIVSMAEAGNVGSGEDTLKSITFSAGTLDVDGREISFEFDGKTASNANSKTLKVKFGSGPTTLLTYGPIALNGGNFQCRGRIVRISSTEARVTGSLMCSPTSGSDPVHRLFTPSVISVDWTTALTLLVTGEGTSDNDIVARGFRSWWHPEG